VLREPMRSAPEGEFGDASKKNSGLAAFVVLLAFDAGDLTGPEAYWRHFD
jgi:hypothetical protein